MLAHGGHFCHCFRVSMHEAPKFPCRAGAIGSIMRLLPPRTTLPFEGHGVPLWANVFLFSHCWYFTHL